MKMPTKLSNLNFAKLTSCIAVLALTGCSLVNPHLDFSKHRTPLQKEGTAEFAGRLPEAVDYANNVRDDYYEAVGTQSKLRAGLSLSLIPMSAAALYLGITSTGRASRDVITGLGLGGAGLFALGSFLENRPRQLIYLKGAQAITCTVAAMTPFLVRETEYSAFTKALDEEPALRQALVSARDDLQATRSSGSIIDAKIAAYADRLDRLADEIRKTAAERAKAAEEASNEITGSLVQATERARVAQRTSNSAKRSLENAQERLQLSIDTFEANKANLIKLERMILEAEGRVNRKEPNEFDVVQARVEAAARREKIAQLALKIESEQRDVGHQKEKYQAALDIEKQVVNSRKELGERLNLAEMQMAGTKATETRADKFASDLERMSEFWSQDGRKRLEKLVRIVEADIARTDSLLREAPAIVENGGKLRKEIDEAFVTLTLAVDRITYKVSEQIVRGEPRLESITALTSGLRGFSASFADTSKFGPRPNLPVEDGAPEAPDTMTPEGPEKGIVTQNGSLPEPPDREITGKINALRSAQTAYSAKIATISGLANSIGAASEKAGTIKDCNVGEVAVELNVLPDTPRHELKPGAAASKFFVSGGTGIPRAGIVGTGTEGIEVSVALEGGSYAVVVTALGDDKAPAPGTYKLLIQDASGAARKTIDLVIAEVEEETLASGKEGDAYFAVLKADKPKVEQVQRALAARLNKAVKVDGDYGAETITAVKEWQALNKYEQTGYLSEAQHQKLLRGLRPAA
tara:strand:+ start:478 stop:2736 length:2259 start_codon:yes stop_codon:yes gene_type:complete